MPDRFEDERGVIQDLLGRIDAVTEIRTRKGCVRGNHVHNLTTQWTYIVRGRLLVAWQAPGDERVRSAMYTAGCLIEEEAGVPHAWRAEEDTTVLVFTQGPRSGQEYERDTIRLLVPLLTPAG